jgi:hypothetical protein
LLQDSDGFVRHNAACAPARIGEATPAAVNLLRSDLKSDRWWIVAGSVVALLQSGFAAKEAVPDLLPPLRHANSTVRGNAFSALERLSPGSLENNPDADPVRKELDSRLPK